MKFIGISISKGVNTGTRLGNAYEKDNERYSTATPIFMGECLNHDITVIEEDIEIYKKSNGNYVYRR